MKDKMAVSRIELMYILTNEIIANNLIISLMYVKFYCPFKFDANDLVFYHKK